MSMMRQASSLESDPVLDEEAFVRRVDEALEEQLSAGRVSRGDASDVLGEAVRYLVNASEAGRARPRTVYHFGRLAGASVPALVDLSVAAELVHGASLLHDDVIDASRVRRGQPSAHVRWSNSVAVLGGDLALCIALGGLGRYRRAVTDAAIDTVAQMSRGIVHEIERRCDPSLDEEGWEAIAGGKTAELFRWCASAPALALGRADRAARYGRCAWHLGIAFQLADDLKDLLLEAGKERYSDIRNGAASYPLIVAARRSERVREALEGMWSSGEGSTGGVSTGGEAGVERLEEIAALVVESGAIEVSRQRLDAELGRALEHLGPDRDRPGGVDIVGWVDELSGAFSSAE